MTGRFIKALAALAAAGLLQACAATEGQGPAGAAAPASQPVQARTVAMDVTGFDYSSTSLGQSFVMSYAFPDAGNRFSVRSSVAAGSAPVSASDHQRVNAELARDIICSGEGASISPITPRALPVEGGTAFQSDFICSPGPPA